MFIFRHCLLFLVIAWNGTRCPESNGIIMRGAKERTVKIIEHEMVHVH